MNFGEARELLKNEFENQQSDFNVERTMEQIILTEDEKQELVRLRAEKQSVSIPMIAYRQTIPLERITLLELELIKPYAEEVIAHSMEEQAWGDLHRSVFLGTSTLFLMFSVNTEEDKKTLQEMGDVKDKEFVGYLYVTYPYGAGTVAHVLHLYVLEKYRGNLKPEILKPFQEEFLKVLKSHGAKFVSMSTLRGGGAYDPRKLGWTETFVNYRMKL